MSMPGDGRPTIAVLGGSGKQGRGLALRWANAGYPVIVGSRDAGRAAEAAAELNEILGSDKVQGKSNTEAVGQASIVALCVPYAAQKPTVEEVRAGLNDKILIDVTVPLVPPKVSRVQLPPEGSAVEAVQRMLGDKVRVVSAFQNISAHHLNTLDDEIDCDVLVCSDSPEAADQVVEMAGEIGIRGWNAGPLANSVVAEALTSVLISLNRRYKVPDAGIRLTGIVPA